MISNLSKAGSTYNFSRMTFILSTQHANYSNSFVLRNLFHVIHYILYRDVDPITSEVNTPPRHCMQEGPEGVCGGTSWEALKGSEVHVAH